MSHPADSEARTDRRDDDRRSRDGDADRDRRRSNSGSVERRSHRRRDDKSRDEGPDVKREERRESRKDGEKRSESSKGDDTAHSSRSHRYKRSRDDDRADDSYDDRRRHKHSKHKKDKKHRHRHTDDDHHHTTDLNQRIQHTKQQLALLSSPASSSASPAVLTADDYFARSAEFRLWLHNSRSQHLDEVDGDKARQLFVDFCTEWNSGRLPAVYYRGVDSSALSGDVLTAHKWRFVGAMSEEDKLANASVRDSVDTATYHHTYQQEFTTAAPTANTAAPTKSSPANAAVRTAPAATSVPAPPPRSFVALSKVEKRQHVREVEAAMDEVAPRETGREAMLLKRREKGEYSRRERGGDAMDELDDDVLMGGAGGDSDLARLKQRDGQRRDKRNTDQAAKRSEWDRKEKERMQAMLQSIGQADRYKL